MNTFQHCEGTLILWYIGNCLCDDTASHEHLPTLWRHSDPLIYRELLVRWHSITWTLTNTVKALWSFDILGTACAMTQHHMNTSQHCDGSPNPLKHRALLVWWHSITWTLPNTVKALWSFDISGTACVMTQHHMNTYQHCDGSPNPLKHRELLVWWHSITWTLPNTVMAPLIL